MRGVPTSWYGSDVIVFLDYRIDVNALLVGATAPVVVLILLTIISLGILSCLGE